MFTRVAISSATLGRAFSSAAAGKKVAVLGAAGGIGQPLSLLLKDSEHISHLSLFDVVNTPGVAADLGHINTRAKVTGHVGMDAAHDALKDADVVVIPAGVPRKPGMTRDDLFNTNASIVQSLATAAAKACPEAMMLIISNPVNSTVPIVAETFKKAGVYDPKRLFGVTTLDVVRANGFVAESQGWNPRTTNVTVIGGHAGTTILPLLSQLKDAKFTDEQIAALTHRIQFGGDEVVKAKDGAGSATLSMAYAGFRFAEKVLRAVKGEKGLVEPSYVYLPGVSGGGIPGGEAIAKETGTDFFSVPIELGPNGAEKATNPLEGITEKEKALLAKATEGLKGNISKGVSFVHNPPQKL